MEESMDTSGMASSDCIDQEETSTLVETQRNPTEWTDEKHCLFLKSMESTFVNQLYKSIDLFGWQSNKNNSSTSKSSSKHKLTSIRASSGQFKVLRDGCWSKLDFVRDERAVDQEEESKVPLANPWIKHYRNSQIQQIRKFPASSSNNTQNQYPVNNFQLYATGSISNTEMSDQNFNEEAVEEEKTERILSGDDHVVPFGDIVRVDDDAENDVHIPTNQ